MSSKRGQPDDRQDLGRRVEIGCREWNAMHLGKNVEQKNSQGKDLSTFLRDVAKVRASFRPEESSGALSNEEERQVNGEVHARWYAVARN